MAKQKLNISKERHEHNKRMLTVAMYVLDANPRPDEPVVGIYESWRQKSGVVVSDAQEVALILQYIAKIRGFDKKILRSMINYDLASMKAGRL